MKTPEEIKKGLECCLPRDEEQCGQCPYCIEGCYTTRIIDTLNYIQQLERERDAAVCILKDHRVCDACLHQDPEYGCEPDCYDCFFEWRGVQEVE